jgi:hypothetical protein
VTPPCQRLANGDLATWTSPCAMGEGLKSIVPGQQPSAALTRQDSRGFETHRAHPVNSSYVLIGALGLPTRNQRTCHQPVVAATLTDRASAETASWPSVSSLTLMTTTVVPYTTVTESNIGPRFGGCT